MLVKIEARILIFPGTDFHFPSTSVPPGTFLRLWNPPTSYMVPYGYTPQSKANRHSHLTTLHPYRRQSNNN